MCPSNRNNMVFITKVTVIWLLKIQTELKRYCVIGKTNLIAVMCNFVMRYSHHCAHVMSWCGCWINLQSETSMVSVSCPVATFPESDSVCVFKRSITLEHVFLGCNLVFRVASSYIVACEHLFGCVWCFLRFIMRGWRLKWTVDHMTCILPEHNWKQS